MASNLQNLNPRKSEDKFAKSIVSSFSTLQLVIEVSLDFSKTDIWQTISKFPHLRAKHDMKYNYLGLLGSYFP